MKPKAKQIGLGDRLRWSLLLAGAAVFLLVPAAVASAAKVTVEFTGSGSGWVKGVAPLDGTPPIECHWNGTEIDTGTPEPGKCEAEMDSSEGLEGVKTKEEADAGSEFAGWSSTGGAPVGCEETLAEECGILSFGGPVTITAAFIPEPGVPLTLMTSGSGSGSFKCDTGSGAGTCKAEYPAGTEVEVIPVDGTGSDFVEFNAENGGECAGASCTVTLSEPRSVNAQFDLESVALSTTVIGEGTVQCAVNGGGLGACPSEVTYGDEVEAVATPNSSEYVLAEISGTGSAAGCEASPCSFTATEASSVTAEFKTAAFKSEAEGNVHGEVPETTTLESECEDVDLGIFAPGVDADYINSCGLVLTSTGAETELTAEDESATHTGHLVQGSYFLPSALQASAEDSEAKGTSAGLVSLNESPGAVTLLSFGVPIAKDASTLEFSQHIGENDGLHTGVYAKTITLTLEQTTP